MKITRYLSILLATLVTVACIPNPPKPPTPPKTTQHVKASFMNEDRTIWLPLASGGLDVDLHGNQPCVLNEPQDGFIDCTLNADTPNPFGAHLDVVAEGYEPFHLDFVLKPVPDFGVDQLVPRPNPAPDNGNPEAQLLKRATPPPSPRKQWSRDYRLDVHMVFSGETICTQQYGCQPWFEPAYQTLASAEDRASVRQQKRDKYRDTHIIVECYTSAGSVYGEPDVWLKDAITRSCEQEPAWFKGLVDEMLAEGDNSIVPIIVYDGDDGSAGHRNAMRQLPFLNDLFAGYDDSVVWARFWDGVFYGSSPEEIQQFGTAYRSTHGDNAVLVIEHQPGRMPVGGGPDDYRRGGRMDAYDGIVGEFDSLTALGNPPPIVSASFDPEHGYVPVFASDASAWMNIWQVEARMTRGYRAPANQPFDVTVTAVDGPQRGQQVTVSSDNRRPTIYLQDSPRGARRYWTFEDGEYEWVRHRVSFADLQRVGNYYRSLGATNVCLP